MFLTLLFSFLAAAAPNTGVKYAPNPLRFIEMKSYKEQPTLPPELLLTFEIDCGDEFVQVIRQEIEDKKTGVMKIAVGGIVQDNLQSNCAGTLREKTVAAGTTFSGRQFEVVKIQKGSRAVKAMKSAGLTP